MVDAVQVEIQEQLPEWRRQAQVFRKEDIAHRSFVVINIVEKRD